MRNLEEKAIDVLKIIKYCEKTPILVSVLVCNYFLNTVKKEIVRVWDG
jgi:hypothetical protein